ncbi:MAG: helix-turn-helix transcriptional regulator [Treponema sp.]|nr:helix-turn-helix transcriptional regulator [Treponema sp.]
MAFWENVEALRKEQNTSYRWLAHKMGMSETTVSSMRKAGTEPRASDAARIAAALGTTVEFLVQDEEGEVSPELLVNYFTKYLNLKKELKKLADSL